MTDSGSTPGGGGTPGATSAGPAASPAQQAQAQADAIATQVREQAQRAREQQSAAMAITGTASSRDGTVRAVVDATGVVTELEFTKSALEHSTLDRLAKTAVATIQQAAAQARGRTAEAWATFHEPTAGVLAEAARGTERLGLPRIGVPEVPRTEDDPTGAAGPWAPDPTADPGAPQRARTDFAASESFDDVRPW